MRQQAEDILNTPDLVHPDKVAPDKKWPFNPSVAGSLHIHYKTGRGLRKRASSCILK